ncbi:hypothetical protein D1614_22485 [Maribellus luteus]|uniref:Uncharacterized protein n=1 Tax=Maribellus luteus TaxID=2305463 RepID=A0A399SRN1_9BACT|nr:hypothetical protein [Maribellus luteus]RIJ45549.1 hypothetical protein D1614_22485 [Maribellus luteus]
MKSKKIKILTTFLFLLPLCVVILGTGCDEEETQQNDYITLKNVKGKIFKTVKSIDNNNQVKDYNWAISVNEEYLNSETTPIDSNILAPLNLSDEFKIPGLEVNISGKKYVNRNRVLTEPGLRSGYGYAFEITSIKTLD